LTSELDGGELSVSQPRRVAPRESAKSVQGDYDRLLNRTATNKWGTVDEKMLYIRRCVPTHISGVSLRYFDRPAGLKIIMLK